MTEPDVTEISTYGGLARDTKLSLTAVDAIARELSSNGDRFVAWLPEWLATEKEIATTDQLVIGTLEGETEKAYLVAVGDESEWLPKSVIRVFRRASGAKIRLPQRGLSEFTTEGSA